MKKKLLSGMAITLVLSLIGGTAFAAAVSKSENGVDIVYAKVDCSLKADGASGAAGTTGYPKNGGQYYAKAYVEACVGSSTRIANSTWKQASSLSNNYITATVGQAYGATEYHSSHTVSGPSTVHGMMVRL